MSGPMHLGPKNHLHRIDSVWMAISIDEKGEGVCAVRIGEEWMPLVSADEARLPWMLEQAEAVAKNTGKFVQIIRLTTREDVRTFGGESA